MVWSCCNRFPKWFHLELVVLKVRKCLSELFSDFRMIDGSVEGSLSSTQRTSSDIDPASIESTHGYVETLPFCTDDILFWHSCVLQNDLTRWLRIPAHFHFLFAEMQARSAFLNQQTRNSWNIYLPHSQQHNGARINTVYIGFYDQTPSQGSWSQNPKAVAKLSGFSLGLTTRWSLNPMYSILRWV